MTNSQWINVFLLVCLGVLLYLIFTDKKPVEAPQIKPISEQKIIVKEDTIKLKKITDSLNSENQKLQLKNSITESELKRLQKKSKEIELRIITDTIYKYSNISDYIDNSNKKDEVCNDAITNLQKQLSNRNVLISQKDLAYKKQLSNLDTCFTQQKKLESYIKNIKPRNQVYIGVSGNFYPVLGYGVDLGIKLKNGLIIEGRALQMQGKTYGQISFKRVISFRK